MCNRYLLHLVLQYVFYSFIDFVLREWSSVELDYLIIHCNARLLSYQSSHLGGVVVFDHDLLTSSRKYSIDEACWEGTGVPYLEEVCLDSIHSKVLHRFYDGALVEPHPTSVIDSFLGPWRVAFFWSGITSPASSTFRNLFRIILILTSDASVMCTCSSCSSPVVQNIPPFWPGIARGDIPSSVNWYRL